MPAHSAEHGLIRCTSHACACHAAAAVMGQSQNRPLRRQCLTAAESTEFRPCAVCLGIGGGSLPLFLAHHFPGMLVQAVELDAVVLAAASQAMGFPLDRCLLCQRTWLVSVLPSAVSICAQGVVICAQKAFNIAQWRAFLCSASCPLVSSMRLGLSTD